jgi:hypothetical protein
MANPVWPVSLPQHLEIDGFENAFPETVERTPMESGPAKQRRRFTAAPEPVKGAVILSNAQHATLKTFFKTTCVGGAIAFDWVHPVTQGAATFRWKAPPRIMPLGQVGGLAMVKASLDLEALP